jgi:hypothetical protein
VTAAAVEGAPGITGFLILREISDRSRPRAIGETALKANLVSYIDPYIGTGGGEAVVRELLAGAPRALDVWPLLPDR